MSQATRPAILAMISCCLGLSVVPGIVRGDSPAEPPVRAGYAPIAGALNESKATGKPTVVLVTSADQGGAARLLDQLPPLLRAKRLDRVVSLAEFDAGRFPDLARMLNVTQTPTVVVYGGRGDGEALEIVGHRVGEDDAFVLLGWLSGLLGDRVKDDDGLAMASAASFAGDAPIDPSIDPAQYGSKHHPSPQQPPAQPPQYQPPQYQPPQYQPPQYTTPPTYQAPPPVTVTPPSQPIIVQPPQQTIVMAPAPGPQVIFASAPPAQQVMMAPPAQPAPNLFMAPAAPAPAPTAQPIYAMAPAPAQPVMMAPPAQQVMMAPPAQQQVMMAPVAAAPAVGQSPLAAAALTIIAPRLIDRMIGALGEHMAERKNPRVRLSEAPTSFALSPAPMAGYAAAPAGYAVMPAAYGHGYAPAPQPCPAPPVGQPCGHAHCQSCGSQPHHPPQHQAPPPYSPAPSPQVEPPHKSFFRR